MEVMEVGFMIILDQFAGKTIELTGFKGLKDPNQQEQLLSLFALGIIHCIADSGAPLLVS